MSSRARTSRKALLRTTSRSSRLATRRASSTRPDARTPMSLPTGAFAYATTPFHAHTCMLTLAFYSLNFSVAIDGQFRLVSGTSASAPAFAAILSAVNDARLASGKSPVGWINPAVRVPLFLLKLPSAPSDRIFGL